MPTGARRARTVARVADHLVARPGSHPLRVAVDGPTAAGKSTLAEELVAAVAHRGRPAVHLSTDDFHHRAEHRRRDADRARGYYRDAFDLEAFRRLVLDPLGPDGDRSYRPRLHDLATDEHVVVEPVTAAVDAVVVVDGSFLQSTPLHGAWDEVLWLATSYETALGRALPRDTRLLGGEEGVREAYATRYHAAGRLYDAQAGPQESATIVVDNEDLAHPVLRRIGGTAGSTVRLFSYGTLQQVEVQLATFGRRLDGTPEALTGYHRDWVSITDPEVVDLSGSDRHPVVRAGGTPGGTVDGTAFTVTTVELAAADTYEVEDYRRVLVRLASGEPAWVYVDTGSGGTQS